MYNIIKEKHLFNEVKGVIMNTIKVYLAPSGRIADLKKDFPLYQGQFQNKLLNVYVPTSILAPDFKVLAQDQVVAEYVAGTAVKIGMTYLARNGELKVSKNYYMRYLKTLTYQNVEYALFERKLPQEFTLYAGQGTNAPVMIINVVNVETDVDPVQILSIITSQTCSLDVMPSSSLDNDEAIEPTELETINARLNSIDQTLTEKQDKTDLGLNTENKTVVGAINELKEDVDTNTANIAQNTEDISTNKDDIEWLRQNMQLSEDYIGQITVDETLPTNTQLTDYVKEHTTPSREPKNGDVIIVIQQIEGQTDKNYRYFYSASGWQSYEIPPLEKASNGSLGIVSGTYGIGSTNNTLVDISGGQILNIYVKDNTGTYRNIREYINANATSISNIVSGNTSVGVALRAIADGLGNNIVNTYLTQTAGATKEFVRQYALPREFNDIFYISSTGYSKTEPTDTAPQFSANTSAVGDFTLFDVTKVNDCEYELSRKNSCDNSIYVSASRDCIVTFRLTTQAKNVGQDWVDLDVELTNPISMTAGQIQRIDISSRFTYLGEDVLDLKVGDMLRQTLEVSTQESTQTTFNVYSNETYPSTFNLNTLSQVVYHTLGKLGEQPVFTLAPNGAITSSGVSLIGSETAQLYNNVECQVIINIPITTVGYELFGENMSILGVELGGESIRLTTPYNYENGVPTFKNLSQVIHSQDAVNGITYVMKCFIKIDSGNNITFIVDEDNLSNYPTNETLEDYVTNEELNNTLENYPTRDEMELTAPQELFMGADGVEETNAYVFEVQNPQSFIDYRTNKTRFLLDLHLPVVGALTLDKQVAITFGDTSYYLYNILKGNEPITIGDLRQVDKYNNATGYRFIFHATFFQNDDLTGFAIIPTISMSDVLSLSAGEMDGYMMDGGLTDGQLAICNDVGTYNAYELGALYQFLIVYPATYSWEKITNVNIELNVPASATQGTLTAQQLAILKANDANGIIFDHEYYRISSSGRNNEGYRTYYNIERENGETSIKTITITENTLAWVLFDLDVEQKAVDETFAIASADWQTLANSSPYTYSATITATYDVGTKTEIGTINDQPILFANYGFVVGAVNGQTITIYAIDKPAEDITLSVRFRG